MAAISSLLGGVGLFLLGMWLMTEGLKLAAGDALRAILGRWTRSSLRGLGAGILITAVVQSSSAVTVATVGFVNAGLLSLGQAVWVVFGANIGTTMTAWLVALLGVKLDVAVLAMPLLGAGMLLRLAAAGRARRAGLGMALAGFGAVFLGIAILQDGFAGLAPHIAAMDLRHAGLAGAAGFLLLGVVLTVVMQSSSAAIAVTLTAAAGGGVPLYLAACAMIGANIGTTSTAVLAAAGASPAARRVATAHVMFNVLTAGAALALLPLMLWIVSAATEAVEGAQDQATALAAFHTAFNCLGVALIWPLAGRLTAWLSRLYVSEEEQVGRPRYLDAPLVAAPPEIALQGLIRELERMEALSFDLARRRMQAGAAGAPELDSVQHGLARLGGEIRAFAERMSGAPLPGGVAGALPDLLRAVHHLDEVAVSSGALARIPPPQSGTPGPWADFRAACLAALAAPQADAEARAAPDRTRAEAYDALKSGLLTAGAGGAVPVAEMEAALTYAQAVRRLADTAAKAERRLRPWRQWAAPHASLEAENGAAAADKAA